VKRWRRGYSERPPQLTVSDDRYPGRRRRYASLRPHELPLGESLEDTLARLLPYWNDGIVPDLRAGRRVIVAAHGNSLRALVKHLDHVRDTDIVDVNIPTGIPLVYELGDGLCPVRHYYLSEPAIRG
jgi:2,3-bisphosphoglycerate-dependent phosphoglycerate mutase